MKTEDYKIIENPVVINISEEENKNRDKDK